MTSDVLVSRPDVESIDELVRSEESLRAAQKWTEAEELLAAAVNRWPDSRTVLVLWAMLSQRRVRLRDAVERFATLRARCPDEVLGYSQGGRSLRWLRLHNEAESILSAAEPRFPNDLKLLLEWTLVACNRRAWTEAEKRGEILLTRQPDAPPSYRVAAQAYAREGGYVRADAILSEGLHRFGPIPELVLPFAEGATNRRDWTRAVRRWEAACQRLPNLPVAHRSYAQALSQVDRVDDAERVILAALARFPDDQALAVEHAWMVTRRKTWKEAHRYWESLRDRFPANRFVGAGLMHVEAQMETAISASVAAATAASTEQDLRETMTDPARLFWQFKSLGETCEIGLVQRHFGIEPISLFRWAATSYDQLLNTVSSDFDGLGELDNTELLIDHDGKYTVRDRHLGLSMHTFVDTLQVDANSFLATQARRLKYLVRKFREEAALAERILIRCSKKPTTNDQIRELHRALRRLGPVTLLYITESEDAARVGTVEWLERDVMLGFIDRVGRNSYGAWDISFDIWLKLCRDAYAMRTGPGQSDRQSATVSSSH